VRSTHTQEGLIGTVAATGVGDERVLDAMRRVPRAGFVPVDYADSAYLDEPIPIPHGQVTTQPSLIARMVAALELRSPERVLEIGSGYGWQTALLAELAASVWSVERLPDLAETARQNLARRGTSNAEVIAGDGTLGLPEHAPYDAIVVSAASPEVPAPLVEQLAPEGRLVHPVGTGGSEDVVLFEKEDDRLAPRRSLTRARFVPLVGRRAFREP
jgi:protein-L-isoaspartate(D-aspartate) O-methyltransferase